MWLWAFGGLENIPTVQQGLADTWPDCRNQGQGSNEDKEPPSRTWEANLRQMSPGGTVGRTKAPGQDGGGRSLQRASGRDPSARRAWGPNYDSLVGGNLVRKKGKESAGLCPSEIPPHTSAANPQASLITELRWAQLGSDCGKIWK